MLAHFAEGNTETVVGRGSRVKFSFYIVFVLMFRFSVIESSNYPNIGRMLFLISLDTCTDHKETQTMP